MNFSIMTASFPIDNETFEEIKALCENSMKVDGYNYDSIFNLLESRNENSRGFFILAYHNKTDQLVGVVSAIDKIGLSTYEWSILVDPMYRQIGIGKALANVLSEALHQRRAQGELALVIDRDKKGTKFVEKLGFEYGFSEATLEAETAVMEKVEGIRIRKYIELLDKEPLIKIFQHAFGDLREESIELINYNTSTEGIILWVAEFDGDIAGTVTTTKQGDIQWVSALAVNPEMQGKGVGSAMLNFVKDYALHNGEKKVMLDVEIENEYALHVYEKAGFIKSLQVDYFVYKGK